MELLEVSESNVMVSDMLESIPEFKALKTLHGKSFGKYIKYLFFVYDKRSPYKNLVLSDRKLIACEDRVGDKGFWKGADKDEVFNGCMEKYTEMTTTHKERLLLGINEKIEEYLDFWKSQKIGANNHELVAETIKNANDLLILQERMEKRIKEEKDVKEVGGGKATLIEG